MGMGYVAGRDNWGGGQGAEQAVAWVYDDAVKFEAGCVVGPQEGGEWGDEGVVGEAVYQ